ncbi:hypothetical protein L226DRAFT_526951 [Lentinus tigrinus ALCF2SS1-7]|uniref:F-box domain-containing protein n=1 Tax=Lentinus tigrinus ALCF2SS1-6 TaxID=1328759 RepID=A0A5C2RTW6_9APHY|nr:hypothetical protein L227DRAFT_657787 [Lentinus tigrinus ALCF2SS1-6]RPD68853.1 hypothetical protein L226DRAFT_526951 [Lentinus tigrinus ALCF2SS1-7]
MSEIIAIESDLETYNQPWSGILRFNTGAEVMSFVVLTLSSDADSRLSSLEGFHFSTGVLASCVAEMLKAFILRYSLTMNITYLMIDYAEEFFGSSTGLAEVFAALKTIKYLKIHDVGIHGFLFLQKTRSCFLSADLSMTAVFNKPPNCIHLPLTETRRVAVRNPIVLLHRSQGSLEVLTGSGSRTLCKSRGRYRQVYENVRVLDLQDNDLPVTTHYAHAFPNLSKLRLETAPEVLSALHASKMDSLSKVRSRNRAQQLDTGTWKSLDACDAPLVDHFMLSLLCPVQKLHVFGSYMNPDMLFQVLKTTRPSTLSLRGFFLADLATGRFTKLLRQPCVLSLKKLELFICVHASDVDAAKHLDQSVAALRPLKILSLSLSISCFFPKRPQGDEHSRDAESSDAAEEYFKGLSLDALAGRITDLVPSLETVSITLEGHPNRPRTRMELGVVLD